MSNIKTLNRFSLISLASRGLSGVIINASNQYFWNDRDFSKISWERAARAAFIAAVIEFTAGQVMKFAKVPNLEAQLFGVPISTIYGMCYDTAYGADDEYACWGATPPVNNARAPGGSFCITKHPVITTNRKFSNRTLYKTVIHF